MSVEKSDLRETIARTLWVRRTSGPQAAMWDEYLAWYREGASNPDSCVHHSSIAMALADADALLPLLSDNAFQAGAEAMRERAAQLVETHGVNVHLTDPNIRTSLFETTGLPNCPDRVQQGYAQAIRSLPLPPLPLKEST